MTHRQDNAALTRAAVAGGVVTRANDDEVEYPGLGKRRVYAGDIEYHYQIPYVAPHDRRGAAFVRESLHDQRAREVRNCRVVYHFVQADGTVRYKFVQEPTRRNF